MRTATTLGRALLAARLERHRAARVRDRLTRTGQRAAALSLAALAVGLAALASVVLHRVSQERAAACADRLEAELLVRPVHRQTLLPTDPCDALAVIGRSRPVAPGAPRDGLRLVRR